MTLTGASTKRDTSGSVVAKELDRKVILVTVPTDGKVRVGLYFNQVSKQIGYIINGTNYGYLNLLAENSLKSIGFKGTGIQSSNVNSKFLGKIIDKANIQFTYPTGTTDICGSTI
ncbi:hypothetical protein MWMV7_MWMV7_00925 [Acinetobacter calcoaceticus]|uniref:DUF4882 domain-containing protein n=1 Tax=Acinetobacter calcoaceticus TaxID=471 RepID=A0A446ZI81_ACICA|nr:MULTISPECIES: DUF4882 family protein [Acinetobacter]CAI3115859.1 hypothetical protein MWMV7_MWMV7_00925 [Acinetobacter calcoaceticus]VAX44232.1 Uncharacterised protein [Acinetobacter calcoaceticus]